MALGASTEAASVSAPGSAGSAGEHLALSEVSSAVTDGFLSSSFSDVLSIQVAATQRTCRLPA